jgi:hypothetical protein
LHRNRLPAEGEQVMTAERLKLEIAAAPPHQSRW